MNTVGLLAEDTLTTSAVSPLHPRDPDERWWRSSVIYQIYPRSFRDSNGDGVGDLPGITRGLSQLAEMDIDAVWLSPFFTSPQKDGGYDISDYRGVDPLFGTLDDFDALMDRADGLGIRVIIDLVPNHCSSEHPWFQSALTAAAGSPERAMFIFRDGLGQHGEFPPNNWQSHFGGPAWTRIEEPDGRPGQWYLHLFDTSQPDLNWDNPEVRREFEHILRFWLDRGVTGFRVDVAHALVKAPDLPDWHGRPDGGSSEGYPGDQAPMFGQPEVHAIYRRWREILDEYDGNRVLCAEACVDPLTRQANWVRADQMHQAFNFAYLHAPWNAGALRHVITESLTAFDAVGAPTTWVLSNHDVVRHTTRFGLTDGAPRGGDGVGPLDNQPDDVTGLDRARAASLLMLALPGGVYLYQGEELGLPDHTQLEPDLRQDPTFLRTGGDRIGRDGCRVPLPWDSAADAFGFSPTGDAWLPLPAHWSQYARDAQDADPASTLSLYKHALRLRKELRLGSGSLAWATAEEGIVSFINEGVQVIMNLGIDDVRLPAHEVMAASSPSAGVEQILQPNQTVWLRLG